jgi:SAM-dependent methyltransferase
MISDTDRREIVDRYTRRFEEFGVDLRSLNPGSEEHYRLQHAVHASVGPMQGKTVLDIGCGLGHYYQFLRDHGCEVDYIGYDLVPAFVESNRERFPRARFEVRDVSRDGIADEADYIVMCQVFNNRYSEGSNADVVKAAVSAAFASARICVSVDMLSKYVNYEEPRLNYFSPEEMFAHGKSLSSFVQLRHDYLPFHFTLLVYKKPVFLS